MSRLPSNEFSLRVLPPEQPDAWTLAVLRELQQAATGGEARIEFQGATTFDDEPGAILDLRTEPTPLAVEPRHGVWRYRSITPAVSSHCLQLVCLLGHRVFVLRSATRPPGDLAFLGVRWPVEAALALQELPWSAVSLEDGRDYRPYAPHRPNALQRILRRITTSRVVDPENWQVGLLPGHGLDLLGPGLPACRWIEAPQGHYFADPFLVEVESRTYLLVEDWDRDRCKGSIAATEIVGGIPGKFRTVLEEDFHLSYPFVVRAGEGGVYMIPEQASSGAVHLYEALEFPWRWRRGPRLVSGSFVDPTLWIDDEGYWLWLSSGGPSWSDELHLYRATRLEGPYLPHPQNPVCSHPRRCRPAGPAFRNGSRLYRPAQNCEGAYGAGLLIYAVEELTRTRYRERLVRSLSPAEFWPDRDGMHHVSSATGLMALDANRYRRERIPITEVLAAKMRSMGDRTSHGLDGEL